MRGYMKLRMPWGSAEWAGSAAGSKKTGGNVRTSGTPGWSSNSVINRQIRSLVPGQTLRGEILSRNGSDVQIRLSDDMVLQAKIDQNMNLEVGKSMTFEVRNNGSALTLSPLFENMSADVNVLKALDMAGLPVNDVSVSMTSKLMEAGLPVDRSSLQQVYRETVSYPQADVADIVALHKLGLPVNETNVNQMTSYRNLTHQLLGGMENILETLPAALESMAEEGSLSGLAGLYGELFELAQEGAEEGGTPSLGENAAADENSMAPSGDAPVPAGETNAADAGPAIQKAPDGSMPMPAGWGNAPGAALFPEVLSGPEEGEGAVPAQGIPADGTAEGATAGPTVMLSSESGTESISYELRQTVSEQLLSVLSDLSLDGEEARQLAEQIRQFGQGNAGAEDFFKTMGKLLQEARTVEGGIQNLHRVFSQDAFRNLLSQTLKQNWTIRPEELTQNGKVEELYRRMDRQLKSLSHALETGVGTDSAAFRAVTSMTQNIDFLNQLNQLYAYVQLPLHLRQGDAQGELYVYANKKNLAQNDGKISALLHLDMEHLGPVDVYVMMEQTKVSTRFYVRDDEMLDFLAAHMHILTQRLAERGYDCSFSMTVREEGQDEVKNSGIGPVLDQEKGVLVTHYAFDVRT